MGASGFSLPTWFRHALGIITANSILLYAAYYVAFGPHGPRAELHPAGSIPKLILAVAVGVAAGGALFLASRAFGKSRNNATGFLSNRADRDVSQPASKDDDKGVAGGFERACPRAEPRPHHRYALTPLDLILGILDSVRLLLQVFHPRVIQERVLSNPSRF